MDNFAYLDRDFVDMNQGSVHQYDELERVNDLIDQQKTIAKYASREN